MKPVVLRQVSFRPVKMTGFHRPPDKIHVFCDLLPEQQATFIKRNSPIMANFFNDNSDLSYQFDRLDLEDIVSILEEDFEQSEKFPDAPQSYQEAMELYRSALELVGELAGDFIAPRAMAVDHTGAKLVDGKVQYAPETLETIEQLGQSDLMGVIIPREDGGLNFPATIYIMMIEMISRADASLMTMFGYQDVGEAVSKFASEEVRQKFLPKYCRGEYIGAMVLTEPSAGSDLQSVKLQAYQDDSGQWYLRGTKHFISNGCGDLLLVLARSEANTTNMFGLSLFVCKGGDKVKTVRLEEKMGLHGSPTCELFFDDAPADLVGRRRQGLLHVLYTLNHARFSVAAQGLGIAEGAYQEALSYARQRRQFGKFICDIPAVANLLTDMRVTLDSYRLLLYNSTRWLDIRNKFEEHADHLKKAGEPFQDAKARFAEAARIVDLLSPMVKYVITEAAVRICYQAQQIHGGMGYIRELAVERFARDVRITTIYEGTTQVQAAASMKGVLGDILKPFFDGSKALSRGGEIGALAEKLEVFRNVFLAAREAVADHTESSFRDAAAQTLADMYCDLYTGYLLLNETLDDEQRLAVAKRFVAAALSRAEGGAAAIRNGVFADINQLDREAQQEAQNEIN